MNGMHTKAAQTFIWGLHLAGWELGGDEIRRLLAEAQKVQREHHAPQIGRNHLEEALDRLAASGVTK